MSPFLWGNIEKFGGTKLVDGSVDVVIVSNVLFQAEDKKGVIEEARRILKQGGTLVVETGLVPLIILVRHRADFPEMSARRLIEALNFSFDRPINAGNFHYGLLFKKGLFTSAAAISAAQPSQYYQ